ncbi:hypothetical protein RHOSPDRAFT_6544, partial [Rhodotorula sp. JG-1b]
DLDPLRLRLVQLIDAVSHLQSQLAAYQHHPPTQGLPPFLELVNRYNLLLTNLAAIHRLVSSEQDQQDQLEPPRRAGESADPKRDKWDSLAVVPAHRVDEAKDWIIGTLLRTKQTPEIEQAQQSAASSLPEPFLSALSSPKEPPQAPASTSFASLSQAQARLVTAAQQKIVALKQFSAGGGEEWDWKARVELDQEEEEEEEDVVMEKVPAAAGSDWTLRDLHVFMQTGKRP